MSSQRDGRTEPQGRWADVTTASAVALVPAERIERTTQGVRIHATALGEALPLCDSERFLDQPSLAVCSGVLIAPDIVLTASHCFEAGLDCSKFAYVFDYQGSQAAPALALTDTSIFGCRGFLVRANTRAQTEPWRDVALVQLDRPVVGRTPANMDDADLSDGEKLAVLGFPLGLPAKIDLAARKLGSTPEGAPYALISATAYRGSSGSGVFDLQYRLRGILVAGAPDLDEDVGNCWRSHRDASDAGEVMTYARNAVRNVPTR